MNGYLTTAFPTYHRRQAKVRRKAQSILFRDHAYEQAAPIWKWVTSVQVTKNMLVTIRMAPALLLVIAIASSLSACSWKRTHREDVATSSGHRAAVLSLQKSTPLSSGCRYGLTLTNNLAVEIEDLTLSFTAYNEADDRLQSVTRGFFGIKPTLQQYAEISFAFKCSQIGWIEVGGFGRCMVGELTLRSAQPGSCLDLVDILPGRSVRLIKVDHDWQKRAL